MEIQELLKRPSLPDDIEHVHIAADGTVRLGRGGELVEFGFRFMDVRFLASTRQTDSGPILQIFGDIAALPYSVENVPARHSALAILEASRELSQSRLVLTRNKRICCIGRTPVQYPWSAPDLIGATADILVEARPYLQFLAEILPNWPRPAKAKVS